MSPFFRRYSLLAACVLGNAALAQTPATLIRQGTLTPTKLVADDAGNVTFLDQAGLSIDRIGPADGYVAVQTLRNLSGPTYYVAVDSHGNLFVADAVGARVREILAASGYSTVVLLPQQYLDITGLALDGNDNLYVSDVDANAVYQNLAEGGYQTVRAIEGVAGGIATDTQGDVFISGGTIISEILAVNGTVPAAPTIRQLAASVTRASAIAVDKSGNLFVTDDIVKEISAAGGYTTATALPGIQLAAQSLAVDNDGNLFATVTASTVSGTVTELTAASGYAAAATVAPRNKTPAGLAFDRAGGLFIADYSTTTISEATSADGYQAATVKFTGVAVPSGLALDSAGNIFITDHFSATVQEFPISGGAAKVLAGAFVQPNFIAVDAAGNLFIADTVLGATTSSITELPVADGYTTAATLPVSLSELSSLSADRAGNLFVAEYHKGTVREVPAAGGYSTTRLLGQFYIFLNIAIDRDSNVFVSNEDGEGITEILATTDYTTTKQVSCPVERRFAMTLDSQGNIFASVTPDGFTSTLEELPASPAPLVAAILPGARSVASGTPATVFASLINTGTTALDDCRIVLPGYANAFDWAMQYQTTDPRTNQPTGSPGTPVTVAGGNGIATFAIAVSSTAQAGSVQAVPLVFACDGVPPAPTIDGVDSFDLVVSNLPIPDIIALSATPSQDGVLHVPEGAAAAFAVASTNIGATAPVTVAADLSAASLPASATLCQTDPASGQCLAPPSASLSLDYAAGTAPTFSVFVQASGAIPFDPAGSRVAVTFSGTVQGQPFIATTSVALATQ